MKNFFPAMILAFLLAFGASQAKAQDSGERVVNPENLQVSGLFRKQIDLKNLPQGSYFVELTDGTGRLLRKLVIAK